MIKKSILVGLMVLTIALLPVASDWSSVSTAFASTGAITAFRSPLPNPHPHPHPCEHRRGGPRGGRCHPHGHIHPHH
jgi:hypothetical protein